MNDKRLIRSRNNRMFFGVCAGLADYLNVDPVIVRLLMVLLTLWNGVGLLRAGDHHAPGSGRNPQGQRLQRGRDCH